MSLITEKYDYKEIKRKQVDGKRLYACPDGNAVASVTTILDKTKDKSHLIAWRKRVGEQKAQEIVDNWIKEHGVLNSDELTIWLN